MSRDRYKLITYSTSVGRGIVEDVKDSVYYIVDALDPPEVLDTENLNQVISDLVIDSDFNMTTLKFNTITDVMLFLQQEWTRHFLAKWSFQNEAPSRRRSSLSTFC